MSLVGTIGSAIVSPSGCASTLAICPAQPTASGSVAVTSSPALEVLSAMPAACPRPRREAFVVYAAVAGRFIRRSSTGAFTGRRSRERLSPEPRTRGLGDALSDALLCSAVPGVAAAAYAGAMNGGIAGLDLERPRFPEVAPATARISCRSRSARRLVSSRMRCSWLTATASMRSASRPSICSYIRRVSCLFSVSRTSSARATASRAFSSVSFASFSTSAASSACSLAAARSRPRRSYSARACSISRVSWRTVSSSFACKASRSACQREDSFRRPSSSTSISVAI